MEYVVGVRIICNLLLLVGFALSASMTVTVSDHNLTPVYLHDLRSQCEQLVSDDKPEELLRLLDPVERKHNTLSFDTLLPSLYNYKGVALFELSRISEALVEFKKAVEHNRRDINAWMNLYRLELNDVSYIYMEALTPNVDLGKRSETGNFHDYELNMHNHYESARLCVDRQDNDLCANLLILPPYLAVVDLPLYKLNIELFMKFSLKGRQLYPMLVNSKYNYPVTATVARNPVLRVGLLLTRIEHNPVMVLIQSLLQYFKAYPYYTVELYGVFLYNEQKMTYKWLENMLEQFHDVVYLSNMSAQQAASVLLTYSLDVLVEMNGSGLSTGIFVLSYRPAVVQVSYLGDPYTTGADFVDYFLADSVVTPIEYTAQLFTEKLLILSTSYMVSSHLLWQSHLLQYNAPIPRSEFVPYLQSLGSHTQYSVYSKRLHNEDRVHFASFHGPTKIDPTVFHIWMNILHFLPNGELVLARMPNTTSGKEIVQQVHQDLPEAIPNIARKYYNNNCTENRYLQCAYHGVHVSQLSVLPSLEWDEHLYVKSGFTMYLDTLFKNGHSTSVDATFAAIPIVALGGVLYNAGRSTQSITHYSNSAFGMVSSVKEYEDLVVRLTKTNKGKHGYPISS
ncbi:hypothetical protein EON65_27830 [archaeon]|nr:MAG: hypothetical protein EON65_27830 [archaeon]